MQAETSNHLFWTCKRAREVWECSKLVLPFTPDQSCSFKDMLWCLLVERESSSEMIAKVVTYAWSLWGSRNEVRKGGKQKTGLELVRGAAQYLEEFYAANRVEEGARNSSTQPVKWTPPQGQILKANVDGAVFAELKAVGIGVVIRDMEGNVKAALSKKINAPLGSVEAEAKAFEIGIQLVKDMGIMEVLIEGDSLIVQRALNELASPPPSVDAVIMGIKEVSADFHHIAFTHIGRQGNKPAHLLAKYAKCIDNTLVWIEETPCVIKQALIHDVRSFQ